MPGLKSTTYGSGDFSWMRNTDGLDEAMTGAAPIANFTGGTHFPDGYLPSGLALRVDDLDNIRPWTDVATAVLGFLKGDHKVTGDTQINVAFITRGNIVLSKLPVVITAPATAVQPRFFMGA